MIAWRCLFLSAVVGGQRPRSGPKARRSKGRRDGARRLEDTAAQTPTAYPTYETFSPTFKPTQRPSSTPTTGAPTYWTPAPFAAPPDDYDRDTFDHDPGTCGNYAPNEVYTAEALGLKGAYALANERMRSAATSTSTTTARTTRRASRPSCPPRSRRRSPADGSRPCCPRREPDDPCRRRRP